MPLLKKTKIVATLGPASENKEVLEMTKKHPEIQAEISAIESAVMNLSQSVAPHLSATNYEKIRF